MYAYINICVCVCVCVCVCILYTYDTGAYTILICNTYILYNTHTLLQLRLQDLKACNCYTLSYVWACVYWYSCIVRGT